MSAALEQPRPAGLCLIDIVGLGARLTRARHAAGLDVADLAQATDLDSFSVASVESGVLIPTARMVQQLADGCGCAAVVLLFPAPAAERREPAVVPLSA